MTKLLQLKEWLTLPEAAKRLSVAQALGLATREGRAEHVSNGTLTPTTLGEELRVLFLPYSAFWLPRLIGGSAVNISVYA